MKNALHLMQLNRIKNFSIEQLRQMEIFNKSQGYLFQNKFKFSVVELNGVVVTNNIT
jgi:hypothetical protein